MSNKKRKIFSSIILSFVLCLCCFCLVACGGNQNKQDSNIDFGSNTAVVYFSATGSTKKIAGYIKDSLESSVDLIEITPTTLYSSSDLNWNNSNSRVSLEHNNRNNSNSPYYRPSISNSYVDFSGYDTIFIGYPIWWGEAPNIVYTFVEQYKNQFEGKNIIPFCTSSSSSLGASATNLKNTTQATGNWANGKRFSSSASLSSVKDWILEIQ